MTGKKQLHVRFRQWIGKPDPSGFGTFYLHGIDPAHLQDELNRQAKYGNQVLAVEEDAPPREWLEQESILTKYRKGGAK